MLRFSRGLRAVAIALAFLAVGMRPGFAQSVSGKVSAPDQSPLPGASVAIPDLERVTISDGEGRYRISDLPADSVALVFSFVGFERLISTVNLRDGDVELNVTLREGVADLDGLIVTGSRRGELLTRASQSVAVLEGADLVELRGQTLGETLGHLAGVTTISTGPTIQKPVIRGLHSDRVVIVNRGLPQEGQQWGAEHAPEIDPFAPARIEVIRGAAGVEYGAGAIGGVVRIEDEALPTDPGFGGRIMLNGFSNNAQAAGSLELEGSPTSIPGMGIRVQGSVRRAGDARTPDYVLANTGMFERSGEIAAGYSRGRIELEGHISRFATDIGIYRGSHFSTFEALDTVLALGRPPVDYVFSYEIGAPKQAITHDLVVLKGQYERGGGALMEVQYGLQHNRRREFDAHRPGGRDPLARPAFDLSLRTHTFDGRLQTRPVTAGGGSAFAVAGVSGMNQANRSEIGYLIPNFRAFTGGAFARTTWLRSPLTVEAGARAELRWLRAYPRETGGRGDFVRTERDWLGFSGALGVIWQFGPSWSLAWNGSAAWRPPSVNELHSYGVHHGSAQFEVGEANLRPERSLGLDATIRHEDRLVRAEVSVYATRISNYIFLAPTGDIVTTVRGVFPEFRYAQTTARLVGLDGGIDVDVSERLTVAMTTAVVRATDSVQGSPLLYMPADRLGLTATARFAGLGPISGPEIFVGASLVRTQHRFPTRTSQAGEVESVDYAPPPEGYALVRAGTRGEFALRRTHIRYSLSAENLFDTAYRDYLSRYRYFAHDPGRNLVLRLQIPFGTG